MNDFKFQLCKRGKKFPTSELWGYQPKVNGIRYAVQCGRPELGPSELVVLQAFGRNSRLEIPDHIREAIVKKIFPGAPPGTILDGEFQYGEDDRSSWSVIGRSRPPPIGTFYVFDCLYGIGDRAPFHRRHDRVLRKVESSDGIEPVLCGGYHQNSGPVEMYEYWLEAGFEGMVAKRMDKPYMPGRHDVWLKFRPK